MAATVAVRGEAVVKAQPDEVELLIEVSYLARTPQEALAEVARRSEALTALFDELSIPRERWTTSGVAVEETSEWDQQAQRQVQRGYTASNRVSVRLADASIVGGLLNAATARAQARIHGPWWRVALDNPARAEACRQAALAARRKAEAYATALGARLGNIVEVREPGVEPPRPEPRREMRAMAMKADAPAEVTVQAGELEVGAAVIVTFAVEQG
jgi:uncharacterized protein YggE